MGVLFVKESHIQVIFKINNLDKLDFDRAKSSNGGTVDGEGPLINFAISSVAFDDVSVLGFLVIRAKVAEIKSKVAFKIKCINKF